MDIITGYTGSPHVTAEQDRDVNIGIFGAESYVLRTGSRLKAEVSSNNEIKVRDGVIMHQGCAASIKKNTYDSLTIANGSQGMKRVDLIVARYSRDQNTKEESLVLKVIQGTPKESGPAVPGYTTGDIQAGDLIADMPLYQVTLNGLNITEVKQLFATQDSIAELSSNLTKANNILTNMESNLMAINTYHMTLNTSNVKTSDSWIECNRIGNLVMVNGCVKITKDVNVYTGINLASGAPAPCCDKQLYTGAIAQDNTYSSCLLSVSKNGEINLYVRWKKALAGDVFYYEFETVINSV